MCVSIANLWTLTLFYSTRNTWGLPQAYKVQIMSLKLFICLRFQILKMNFFARNKTSSKTGPARPVLRLPTDPFAILMLQNPSHEVPELNKTRWFWFSGSRIAKRSVGQHLTDYLANSTYSNSTNLMKFRNVDPRILKFSNWQLSGRVVAQLL